MSDPAQPSTPPPPEWAAPGAPPFGAPQAATGRLPGYAPPVGYALQPAPGPAAAPASVRRGKALGVTALVASLVAVAGASLVGAVAAWRVGLGAGRALASRPIDADFDWSVLTPVREWVLAGEIAFWFGTVVGLWALVQGVVAIATARGRGAGIPAVVIAALGPVAFALVVQALLTAGLTSGSGIGG